MQVIVLGAGLLGLTSAHHLQQLGHDVVVVDRHDTPGARVQRGERDRAAPVSTGFRRAPLWRSARRRLCGTAVWLDRTLRPEAGRHPVEQALQLRSYSREALRQIQADAGIPTSAPPPLPLSFGTGTMTFYTSRRAFARAAARAEQLRSLGSGRRLLSVDEALRIEPALRPIRHRLAGATWSVEREPGSPERIANALVALCRAAGVRFLMNHTLAALHEDRGRIGQIELRDATGRTRLLRADAYVLALGDDSAMHAASVGIDLALRPVREDRVTLPVTDADGVCRVPLRDHEAGLKFTRIRGDGADLLRVERTARAACGAGEHDAARFAAMVRHTQALFPGATDAAQAHFHTGLRAATPHDLPLIGRSRMRNLYLHVAHGPTDWIDACGSGKSIARIVSGLQPEFEFGFTGRECC